MSKAGKQVMDIKTSKGLAQFKQRRAEGMDGQGMGAGYA